MKITVKHIMILTSLIGVGVAYAIGSTHLPTDTTKQIAIDGLFYLGNVFLLYNAIKIPVLALATKGIPVARRGLYFLAYLDLIRPAMLLGIAQAGYLAAHNYGLI